ncbi:MAG: Gfo/Idh/MocA family oxidoreductase [Gemmataceae bacterium]|nr:Gfo/Idh/MocA family oxidoreductase [Gemmataceae bacterium]
MVRIGLAGIGFMGRIHFLAAQKVAGAEIAAVCSRDPAKLAGDWTNTRGNFGPPPGKADLSGIRTYSDYGALLADPGIDLIDLCTVTDQHAPMAIRALQAGKHVLVEKAIALTLDEAEAMLAAAKKAGRLLMVAHVLPFFPEFKYAAEAVRGGRFGKLLGGHLTRVISRPDWSADMADAAKTGGPAVDLHIHDTHFIGLIAGVPKEVRSQGIERDGAVEYLTTQYLYGPGGPALTCSSGAVAASARPFVHGFELYLEKATLVHSSGGVPLTVFHADGRTERPALGSTDPIDAFADEIGTAAQGVREGKEPALLSGRLAADALAMCFKEIASVKGEPGA